MPCSDVYCYRDRSAKRKRIERELIKKGLVPHSSKFELVLWRKMKRR